MSFCLPKYALIQPYYRLREAQKYEQRPLYRGHLLSCRYPTTLTRPLRRCSKLNTIGLTNIFRRLLHVFLAPLGMISIFYVSCYSSRAISVLTPFPGRTTPEIYGFVFFPAGRGKYVDLSTELQDEVLVTLIVVELGPGSRVYVGCVADRGDQSRRALVPISTSRFDAERTGFPLRGGA